MEIKLLHLYYDIMNLYGEYGNIKILEQHLKDQGFDVSLEKKSIGEKKNLKQYDFIYIGCGTEKNQQVILQDILPEKEDFINFIEDGKTVLLTGNSFEILGKSIDKNPALDIFDFETEHLEKRETSDVICTSEISKNKIVGFINTMSVIKNNDKPLLKIEWNSESEKINEPEGLIYKNLIGTHLIGPLLIRNPEILRVIIEKICKQKDENFKIKEIEYEEEQKGYELVLKELEQRKEIK